MHASCRMMDRNANFSITKVPALSLSNFFFAIPPNEGYDKDLRGILSQQDDTKNSNRKLSRQTSLDQPSIDGDTMEIPQIHITSNDNSLSLPSGELGRKIPIIEAYPVVKPNIFVETEEDDNYRSSGKHSCDEGTMQRAHSEQYIFENCIIDSKNNNKSRKKFKPIFRNISKSTECLDVEVEPGSPKTKSPVPKRRFQRGASDPHIEASYLRSNSTSNPRRHTELHDNNLISAKSLINIRSPFAPRKQFPKLSPDDEKKKMHVEMLQCIRNDDCKGFRSLLKKRIVDVNIVNKHGSLIHDASYKGCTKCIKALLKGGCFVNLCDDFGWTALHAAVLAKNLDAIKLLIENNAFPNQLSTDGLSPCHLAVMVGDLHIIHELVRAGGDPLVKNAEITPFQLAIDLKKSVVLDYFLHMPSFLVDM